MKTIASVLMLFLFLRAPATAGLRDDYDNQIIALMKSDVGRKVWISNRGNQGMPLCATQKQRNCPRVSHTSLTIKSLVAAPRNPDVFAKQYLVQTEDGKTGYVGYFYRDQFIDHEPTQFERYAITECEDTGPKIGMSKTMLIYCWGSPAQTNVTQTTGGSHEQLVYGTRGYVYITDGLISAIQTSR
jgi:hypothetical protein